MEPSPAASAPARLAHRPALQRDIRYVDSDEFLRLLVSPRHLERVDQPGVGLLGLCDRDTGERYLIEEGRIPAQDAFDVPTGSPPAAS